MSRVITFSRSFPSYHPRKGEPTYFVEKLLNSIDRFENYPGTITDLNSNPFWELDKFIASLNTQEYSIKYHTIRAGHRWKAGDFFSPRIWSGKPYNSKQIIIAPDMEVKRVYEIQMSIRGDHKEFSTNTGVVTQLKTLAENDGLELNDLLNWFNKPFSGQIICWNDEINY